MTALTLNEDQRDALQEAANIGMGQAADLLAQLLGEFVELSVPRIRQLEAMELMHGLSQAFADRPVSLLRQGFQAGGFRGEALMLYCDPHSVDLVGLLGYRADLDEAGRVELLLDMTNILVGACLGKIAEQLGEEIGFSSPSLLGQGLSAAFLDALAIDSWPCALLVEIALKLERRSFACQLALLMPESELVEIARSLDRFIAKY